MCSLSQFCLYHKLNCTVCVCSGVDLVKQLLAPCAVCLFLSHKCVALLQTRGTRVYLSVLSSGADKRSCKAGRQAADRLMAPLSPRRPRGSAAGQFYRRGSDVEVCFLERVFRAHVGMWSALTVRPDPRVMHADHHCTG